MHGKGKLSLFLGTKSRLFFATCPALLRSSWESLRMSLDLSAAPSVGQHNFVIVSALHYKQLRSNSCCCFLIYWISENSIRPGQGASICCAGSNEIKLRALQLKVWHFDVQIFRVLSAAITFVRFRPAARQIFV